MNLVLRRRESTSTATVGELYADNQFVCYTLEDVVRERAGVPVSMWKLPGETAIPQGRYRVTITPSERFKRPLPLVNMVEGFTGIRIHPGNSDSDTAGCILPGRGVSPDGEMVLSSVAAFDKLYKLIDDALMEGDDVFIEIRNAERHA